MVSEMYSIVHIRRGREEELQYSNQTQFEYEKEIKDKEGRYIIVKGRLKNEPITLINIHAPPESGKMF